MWHVLHEIYDERKSAFDLMELTPKSRIALYALQLERLQSDSAKRCPEKRLTRLEQAEIVRYNWFWSARSSIKALEMCATSYTNFPNRLHFMQASPSLFQSGRPLGKL